MSEKFYCDVCGAEMQNGDRERLRRRLGPLTIEVMHAVNSTWNGGDVCHRCILTAISGGEPADASCGYLHSWIAVGTVTAGEPSTAKQGSGQ